MTYEANEVSVRDGKPNELYKFEGTYSTYCYTSGPVPISYDDGSVDENGDPVGAETYLPVAVQRGAVNAGTQEDDNLDLTISMSVKHQVVLDYAFQDTPPSLQLTIYRYHTLADVRPFWFGPVNNIQVTDGKASIRSYSKLGAALSQQFPNIYYQSPCNHTLYDRYCGVVYADHSASLAVTLLNARTITFAAIPVGLIGKLLGGEVKLASGERRMITASTATTVTVNFPFSGPALTVGDEVTIAKGCDLAYLGDCKASFANQINFGGFPFIPSANPFSTGIDPAEKLDDNTCLPSPFTGARTIYHYFQNDPCNPTYTPSRQLYTPGHTPNAPHGKYISSFNPMPGNGVDAIYEYDDYVNPASPHYQDPEYVLLQGQVLVDWNITNLECTFTFHFLMPFGDWAMVLQYGAFFCGTVGKPFGNQRIVMTKDDGAGNTTVGTVVDQGVEGNVVYDFTWEF